MAFWDVVNQVGSGLSNLFTGQGSPWEFISNPSSWWDQFKNGRTNIINEQIANQNLDYQRERNEIEDTRYEDETQYNRAFAEEEQAYQRAFAQDERNYNRAFAEEERAYNRALQQELFNREDTAIERQAASLSKMGINPLSQNMNGLGAGQVVSSSLPGSTSLGVGSLPGLSSRGGSALHNDFKMQDQGMLPALSALSGLASVMNGISTGQYQRDSLALQNDRMYLENMKMANDIGLDYTYGLNKGSKYYRDTGGKYVGNKDSFGNFTPWNTTPYAYMSQNTAFDEKYDKHRDFMYKKDHNIFGTADSKINFLNELSTLDFEQLATQLMTNIASTGKKLGDDFKKDFGADSSPFMKFFKLFF